MSKTVLLAVLRHKYGNRCGGLVAPVETPGHVLQEYRLVLKDVNQRAFADFDLKRAWTEGVQRRLEDGGTRFKQWHLDVLVNRTGLKKDSAWYRRFEAAMVGDEWPPIRERVEISLDPTDTGGETERVLIPVNLKGKRGRLKLVLELVIGAAVLCVVGYRFLQSGYAPWNYPEGREITKWSTMQYGGGGDDTAYCSGFVYTNPDSLRPIILGTQVEINVLSPCARASIVRIDGIIIGWSKKTVVSPSGQSSDHRIVYLWDTIGFEPGKHTLTVEFIGRFRIDLPPLGKEEIPFILKVGE